jgi:hypothetical protein
MFEDILIKDPKPNKKVVCPTCGVVILTIETEFDSEDYDIENWNYECKQCVEKTLHCIGGCGKTVLMASKGQVKMTTWTCKECVDKRFGDV